MWEGGALHSRIATAAKSAMPTWSPSASCHRARRASWAPPDKGPIGSHPDGSRGRVARVDHAAYYLSDGVVGPVRRLLRAVCLSASPSSFVAL
jgi:hypothetical protein